jgi:hypothetical protein
VDRAKLKNLLLLLASLGLSLVLVEGALRIAVSIPVPPYPPVTSRPELYQEFEPYGYRLWPSRTNTYLYPRKNPRQLTVVSNSAGFRDSRELHEPDHRTRILVVGDSFVFGEGVEERERFTNVLEIMEPGWRVDNLGMTGFGPDLMLRALEEIGLESSPNAVAFCIYTDDFRRVQPHYAGVGFKIPRFELKSHRLVTVSYPSPRMWDELHCVQMMRQLYWNRTNALYELNAAIFDRFLELSKKHGFTPLFIFLPAQKDYSIDKARRTWLRKYAEQHAAPFLDLTDKIHSVKTDSVFIPSNMHLNPSGHNLVAAELHRFLAGQILAAE